MLEDFYKVLSKNSKKLIDNGYFIVDIEDIKKLNKIRNSFVKFLSQEHNLKISPEKLGRLHEYINVKDINKIRVGFFQEVNNFDNNFALDYLDLAKNSIFEVVGTELASNKMVNFSIQMPNDETSILPLHSDMFSGESSYQINLWVPLTDAKDTNSMFIFNPTFSQQVCNQLGRYEEVGLDSLMSENKDEYRFLNIPYGKALIFSSTCLHGNVLNKTHSSRLSFNCRYKNLFTPYNQSEESSKKLGSFYQPLSPKAATLIGLNFNLDE